MPRNIGRPRLNPRTPHHTLGEELIDRDRSPDHDVRLDLHAQSLERGDLLRDIAFGRRNSGMPVDQHAARAMQRLEDRHVVALTRQVARSRQPAGPEPITATRRSARPSPPCLPLPPRLRA